MKVAETAPSCHPHCAESPTAKSTLFSFGRGCRSDLCHGYGSPRGRIPRVLPYGASKANDQGFQLELGHSYTGYYGSARYEHSQTSPSSGTAADFCMEPQLQHLDPIERDWRAASDFGHVVSAIRRLQFCSASAADRCSSTSPVLSTVPVTTILSFANGAES
ncbi:hypothetical protein CC86DRAFT_187566 [Ophiobolus disseminans]|uniref:Uncharacterized protein n=1 Tax=Ophiobolus disseminans TaxID=1469910 RepID=A0A6A7A9J3_9PLEO|nr:hypothetical protein CC86DRAFT_187566 [Ophiobolus disseminans]